ncbi:MAG: geranylgeranyl pyrophosphate synthase [Polyangiaceae bacterium]|nr:geranylgeranyl pyrophosphate synthase [Polyangiaceae bacterium]
MTTPVTAPAPEEVEDAVLARLAALRGRLGGDLGAAFDGLAARLRLFEGRAGEGYFSHPPALPVLELPVWIAAHLTRRGAALPPGRALDLAESAAAGYLRVRMEDDWFDEGVGEPHEAAMLAQALFARHAALIARGLSPGSPYWALFEEVWAGYGEAMLLERRLHRGEAPHDAAAFRRVLARTRPLVLPAAAALFGAGREADLDALERVLEPLAASHQLFTDLLHARKDRAAGNATHALFRLGVAGGDSAALGAALFAGGGFGAILADARRELDAARAAAAELSAPELARCLERRAEHMAATEERIVLALLTGAPAGGAAPR